ncbi:MAG: leucine-rich repeat domain-containing protein, partial [Acutalibacteraceae bacterium]|nr:leucine-rich repeat domain-containing protein [Acutalibacteraceae bacterium]
MKKNRLKKTLAILLSVVMAQGIVSTTTVSTSAVDTQVVESQISKENYGYFSNEDWEYLKYSDHICVTQYLGTNSEVVVPSTIDNLPVTTIYETFWLISGVTRVTIPEGITVLGYMAFACCGDLEYINIPSTVNTIEAQAFEGCKNLKVDLIIPDGVSTLENSSFSEIPKVPSVLVPDSVTSIDKYTFFLNDGPVVYYSSKNTAMKEFA